MKRNLFVKYKSVKEQQAHRTCRISFVWVKLFGIMFVAGILFSFTAFPVSAEVYFSRESTGRADSIYVAGNPDFYPVEYYNSDTGCYEGMIPELLRSISEDTGLNFTYISSDKNNQQERLAKNGQVEIVSAYLASDEEIPAYLSDQKVIFSVLIDGKKQDVCLGFTKIASDKLVDGVTESIENISDRRMTEIAVSSVMKYQQKAFPLWLLRTISVLCIFLLIFVMIFIIQFHKFKKAGRKDKLLDTATGIGNKTYFAHYFEHFISDQSRELYFVAYFAFDISHFNQYYGHEEVENILRFAADVLKKNSADNDILARVTGGGFGLAFQSSSLDTAQERVEHLLYLLNQFGSKHNPDHEVRFCAGIYSMTQRDRSCEKVLYNAQQGYLYAVKNDLLFSFCNNQPQGETAEGIQLQKQIISALKNHEFKLYFQFIVDKATKKITGAEVLSRWQHPQNGLLSPRYYISTMEHLGNIRELDFYIFEKVCQQLESWKNIGLENLMLSCNFTRLTISADDFVEQIRTISSKYSFDRSRLIVEITEDIMERNEENAFRNIRECKKEGYQIALDDFGEGYTSFSNLYNYDLDYIKIDKNIVQKAETSEGKALLNGIITLGHNMGIKVLCEGIETEQQNELICHTECDLIQGYYYSWVIPQEEIMRFLKKNISKPFLPEGTEGFQNIP